MSIHISVESEVVMHSSQAFLHLETGKHDSYFYIPVSSNDYVDYVLEEQLPGKKTYHFQYMIKSSKVTHVCTHLVI